MVGWSVGRLVGRSVGLTVTHSFDNPHVAPFGLLGLVNQIFTLFRSSTTLIALERTSSLVFFLLLHDFSYIRSLMYVFRLNLRDM